MRKLKLTVPEFRLLQRGEFEYSNFQKALEKATRADDSMVSLVFIFFPVSFRQTKIGHKLP